MEGSNNKPSNYLLWGLTGGAICAILGSAYYIYSLFSEEEVSIKEEDNEKIEELMQELPESSDGKITPEIAMYIAAASQRMIQEKFDKEYPDFDENRRALIDKDNRTDQDEYQYKQMVFESLQYKESQSRPIMNHLCNRFNTTEEKLTEAMQNLNLQSTEEMERLTFKYDKPKFQGELPDQKAVKSAFKFFVTSFKTHMMDWQKTFNANMGNIQNDPYMQQQYIMEMMIIRQKVEDRLYINFKMNEIQMKYLLYKYELDSQPDVRELLDSVNKLMPQ